MPYCLQQSGTATCTYVIIHCFIMIMQQDEELAKNLQEIDPSIVDFFSEVFNFM